MISLERFAELRAAIERGFERDSVLRREKLPPAEWIRSQRHWLDALANEVATGDGELAARYCRAFEDARPAASDERPEHAALAVATPAAPAASTENARHEATLTPSYLRAALHTPELSATPLAVAPIAANLRGTALAIDVPRAPVMPFQAGASSPPLLPTAPRALQAASRIPTGTALAVEGPRGPATPFRSDSVEPIANLSPGPGAAHAGRLGTGTEWAPPTSSTPATPFQPVDAESLGFSVVRYAELVAARSQPGADPAAVLAQFGIDAAASTQIEAYWQRRFAGNGLLGLDFGRQVEQATKALNERRKEKAAAAIGTGTRMLPTPTPLPELSVDQYAWLTATLRRCAPADLPPLLARMRLTPQTRLELEQRWKLRMSEDSAVQQAFLSALATHLGTSAK